MLTHDPIVTDRHKTRTYCNGKMGDIPNSRFCLMNNEADLSYQKIGENCF